MKLSKAGEFTRPSGYQSHIFWTFWLMLILLLTLFRNKINQTYGVLKHEETGFGKYQYLEILPERLAILKGLFETSVSQFRSTNCSALLVLLDFCCPWPHLMAEKHIPIYAFIFQFDNKIQNSAGCYVKPNPRYFPFHLYWACVNKLGPMVLYFPHLIISLALIFVLLERLLTRYYHQMKPIQESDFKK